MHVPRIVWMSVIVLLIAALMAGIFGRQSFARDTPFDAKARKADLYGSQDRRRAMLQDLFTRNLLNGLDAAAVQSLLGDPARGGAGTVDSEAVFAGWDAVFYAGCADTAGSWLDPFGVDCNYLCVKFGPDGRVCAVGWVRV